MNRLQRFSDFVAGSKGEAESKEQQRESDLFTSQPTIDVWSDAEKDGLRKSQQRSRDFIDFARAICGCTCGPHRPPCYLASGDCPVHNSL
jgi:hypothetical protein